MQPFVTFCPISRWILPTLIALVLVGVTLPAAVTNPEDAPSELQSQPGRAPARRWADWIEPDFPFFSSVVDARGAGPGSPANNLATMDGRSFEDVGAFHTGSARPVISRGGGIRKDHRGSGAEVSGDRAREPRSNDR